SRALEVTDIEISEPAVQVSLDAEEAGTVRAFAWQGEAAMVPVWESSCAGDELGFAACSAQDGAVAPWGPDMGGQLLGSATAEVTSGRSALSMELGADALEALRSEGAVLVSFQAADGGVDAWHFPVIEGEPAT